MNPRDFEYYRRLARDMNRLVPPPAAQEGLRRQAETARALLDDPAIRAAHKNAARIVGERRDLARNMPNAATQKAISDAARFFDSDYFRSQSDTLARSLGLARVRLGPEGLASSGRVAGRRAAESPGADETAELIETGDAETLLEEAAELAASPEVRDLIERADVEALVRLDEQQVAEAEARGEVPQVEESEEVDRLAEIWAERPNRRQLIKVLDGGLLVIGPLEAGLAAATQLVPSSELAAKLAAYYLIVAGIVGTARLLLALMEDDES